MEGTRKMLIFLRAIIGALLNCVYDHPLWGNENCENTLCDDLMAENKQTIRQNRAPYTLRTHNFPIFQFAFSAAFLMSICGYEF